VEPSFILEQIKIPFIVLEPFVTITSTVPAVSSNIFPRCAVLGHCGNQLLLSASSNASSGLTRTGAHRGAGTLFFGGHELWG
jgi:hypothetical protein